MKTCSCGGKLKELEAKTPDNITYKYFLCLHCKEEFLDRTQLHEVAEKYRTLKKYQVKLSAWGLNLGLRLPKELAKKYHLTNKSEVVIIPEKDGLKIIPATS